MKNILIITSLFTLVACSSYENHFKPNATRNVASDNTLKSFNRLNVVKNITIPLEIKKKVLRFNYDNPIGKYCYVFVWKRYLAYDRVTDEYREQELYNEHENDFAGKSVTLNNGDSFIKDKNYPGYRYPVKWKNDSFIFSPSESFHNEFSFLVPYEGLRDRVYKKDLDKDIFISVNVRCTSDAFSNEKDMAKIKKLYIEDVNKSLSEYFQLDGELFITDDDPSRY